MLNLRWATQWRPLTKQSLTMESMGVKLGVLCGFGLLWMLLWSAHTGIALYQNRSSLQTMVFIAAGLVTGTAMYWLYYRMHYGKKPTMHWKDNGNWQNFLKIYVKSIHVEYWPFYFVPGGKFQTVVAALLPKMLPKIHKVNFNREILLTPDGGQFVLAWANESHLSNSDDRPIILIYPGLAATSNSIYVNMLTSSMIKNNYTVVVMVNRGLEAPCLTAKSFCATHTIDLELTITELKKRHPNSPIVSIGLSLGGLVLTRYLAQKGTQSKILAAFIYSCPFNPVKGSKNIERWDNWLLYNLSLTKDLKTVYTRSQDKFTGVVDHKKLMRSRSIREIDIHFTSKVFGYESVDHYYEDAIITKEMIFSIQTPTLCLNSSDDAFSPENSLPVEAISQSDFVALAKTSGGGHVSHLCGLNPLGTPYYVDMFIDYANSVLRHQKELPNCEN